MITVRMTAEVKEDRRVIVTLPPEVSMGPELVVTVKSSASPRAQPRGVTASASRGIATGSGLPPDDATPKQWIQERRLE